MRSSLASLAACVALCAALLSSTAAAAGDYLITGPELAGRATIKDLGNGRVSVTGAVRSFPKGAATPVTGDGKLGPQGLSFGSASGQAKLGRGSAGQLSGTLSGRAQTWTPVPSAQGLIVLVVPGLSTNGWNKIGIPYLDENLAALQAFGFQARRLAINTEAGVAANAAYINGQIRAEHAKGNRVLLFAHSKGAVDTTAALALDPSLLPMVAGVIAVQPVWKGSPMAEMVAQSHLLEAALKLAIEKVLKGSKDAVMDLDFARRKQFIAEHPYPAALIPTVVVRSSFNRRVSKSILYADQKYISLKYKQPNDGMVTFADQAIPGAVATIDLADMDHFEPGLRNESKATPLIVTTRALLAMLPKLK